MVKDLTDQNFESEIKGVDLVMVDFWAPWCGPCRVQGPIVEELAESYKDRSNITIAKMNVDENPVVSQAHSIMSIPTLVFFKGGALVAQLVGLQSKASITSKLQELLKA